MIIKLTSVESIHHAEEATFPNEIKKLMQEFWDRNCSYLCNKKELERHSNYQNCNKAIRHNVFITRALSSSFLTVAGSAYAIIMQLR